MTKKPESYQTYQWGSRRPHFFWRQYYVGCFIITLVVIVSLVVGVLIGRVT